MDLFSSSETALRRRWPKSPSSTCGEFQSHTLFIATGIIMMLLLLSVTVEVAVPGHTREDGAGDEEEAGLAFDNVSPFSADWGDPPVSEQVATQIWRSNSSSGGGGGNREGRRELYGIVDVTESGAPCRRNPLWDRRVDAGDYEYGCRAIKVNPDAFG